MVSPELYAAEFRGLIGVARADITPPEGIYSRNWGAAAHDTADGVHRPMTLTALALSAAEGPPLILVAADLGRWRSLADEWHVRGGIVESLGLDPSRVIIALSHTHAGPSVYRDDVQKPGGELIAGYLDQLRLAAVKAAKVAMEGRSMARLSWRYGRCGLARNRDLPELGSNRFVVGFNPAAEADDTLLVGRVISEDTGRPLAIIVNYACHPTTLAWDNHKISPDYVGALRELVERETGASCLFLQGASGELAPAKQYSGDLKLADSNGRRLGHAVLETLEAWNDLLLTAGRVVESGAALATYELRQPTMSRTVHALQSSVTATLKPLPSIAEIELQLAACSDRALRERLWRKRGTRQIVGDGATAPIPIWVWRIGEAVVVAQPNEAYSMLQTELRLQLAPRPVAVINLGDGGGAGYLPPRGHFERDQYTVWQTPFAAGTLEAVIDRASDLAKEAVRG